MVVRCKAVSHQVKRRGTRSSVVGALLPPCGRRARTQLLLPYCPALVTPATRNFDVACAANLLGAQGGARAGAGDWALRLLGLVMPALYDDVGTIPQNRKRTMIKLYYHPSPNPAKVALMLEEAGLQYELVPV